MEIQWPTICAIATPPGQGGIGIVKISGTQAIPILGAIFRPKLGPSANAGTDFQSHRAYYGFVMDPDTRAIIDEVVVLVMKGPRSYTREDVVEIQSHAGVAVMKLILELVIRLGAQLAEPGEFTKRAFLNGRIDLTQAEAIIDVVNAKTETALEIASKQLAGQFGDHLRSIRQRLVDVMAHITAVIDFPEDVEEADFGNWENLANELATHVVEPIRQLIAYHESSGHIREGLRVVITGKPNVGKSSLANRILNKERMIVTPIPGTTRDAVEDYLNIKGVPMIVTDTAGIHATEDPAESMGIEKSMQYIQQADLILFVLDGSEKLDDADDRIYQMIQDRGSHVAIIVNKIDLVPGERKMTIPEPWKQHSAFYVSAKYNQGMEAVVQFMVDFSGQQWQQVPESGMIPNLRQRLELERCLQYLDRATEGLCQELPLELVADDLEHALNGIHRVLGIAADEAVMDQVFEQFCIGK